MFSVTRIAFAVLLLSWCGLTGCLPSGTSTVDEEKEPHFLEGKSRVASMDFHGAIESYERALEVNPRSSAAHFELGLLYDQRDHDPAAAIYHYSCYLKLHSEGVRADRARMRITACKLDLVQNVSPAPGTQSLQRENEQLTEENRRLKTEVERWRAYYNSVKGNGLPNSAAGAEQGKTPPPSQSRAEAAPAPTVNTELARVPAPAFPSQARAGLSAEKAMPAKTHTVRSGDTPAGIARKYGVKVDVLMAANPRADARHLQIGQSLVIPTP
jgi:LysM repeat protein